MNIDPQRKTWSNFMKLTTYTCGAIVAVLGLMAIFFALSFCFRSYFSNELLTFKFLNSSCVLVFFSFLSFAGFFKVTFNFK
jgi:hypothetical protein